MSFDDTWSRFCALDETAGPTGNAIDDWRRGRERYAVWALRVIDPAVIARMAEVAARLGDGLVRVRPEDAHVTVWVCGFPAAVPALDDDVAEEILVAQRAAVAGLRPPRLLVGAANAFATSALHEVHDPYGDLAALRVALAVPGANEVRFAPYQPHVTVGRFGDSRPAAPIARALAGLRAGDAIAPRDVRDGRLELIELDARVPDRMKTVWPSPRCIVAPWQRRRSRTRRNVSP
jgi:hypothetical protein